MIDFDGMTDEEVKAWADDAVQRSRAEFAGQPSPAISRVKATDYPHLEQVGWGFPLWLGGQLWVWRQRIADENASAGRGERGGVPEVGRVLGLRDVADGGPRALIIELGAEARWALRRRDGIAEWAERPTSRWAHSTAPVMPVDAWPCADSRDSDDVTIRASESPAVWSVKTLHDDQRRRKVGSSSGE